MAAGAYPECGRDSARLPGVTGRGEDSRPQDSGDSAMRVGHALTARGANTARVGLRERLQHDRRLQRVERSRPQVGRGSRVQHG